MSPVQPDHTPRHARGPPPTAHRSTVRVLVVEDRPVARKLIADEIRSAGVEVAGTARDGDEAVRLVKELSPDVVLLDVVMPGKDGIQTLAEIRAFSDVPIVMLTAAAIAPATLEHVARRRGADAFFLKPSGNLSLDLHRIHQELIDTIRSLGVAYAADAGVIIDPAGDPVPNA